ncbi:MAG: hypothetical protein K0U54_11250, partial [Bacteroidetes bacterium]|nr:hypothetical protein [Bacteroidota bacterium]
ERLERISNHYDPKIAEATTTYNSLLDKNNTVEEKLGPAISTLEELEIQLLKDGPNLNDEEFKKLEAKVQKQRKVVADLHTANDSLTKAMDKAQAELTKYKTQKKKAISKINFTDEGTAGLFFNLQIAEQVPDGNYTPATAIEVPSTNLQPPKSNSTASGDKVTTTKTPTTWEALIKDDTTDNFGNPLVIGNLYVPVVLSYSTAAEEVADEFTNAITNYALTPPVTYAGTNN